MEDRQILELYWQRSEQALFETEKKYGRSCRRIAQAILGQEADSEECVNDTWLRAWNSIPPHRPERLGAFLGKIARNLALDRCKKRTAQKRSGDRMALALEELEECIPGGTAPEQAMEDRLLVQALERFLEQLPPEKRRIFLLRYWHLYTVEEIAGGLDLGQSKVKMTLLRTREKLRIFLEKEGVGI